MTDDNGLDALSLGGIMLLLLLELETGGVRGDFSAMLSGEEEFRENPLTVGRPRGGGS